MAEEYNVTFSNDFLRKAKELETVNAILSFIPEDMAKQTKMIFRALAKRGVPAKLVLEALGEVTMEGGFEDG